MSAKTFWKTVALGLFSLSSITIAKPSFAVSVNLSSFTRTGDVGNVTATQATITNAYSDGGDDAINYNVSGYEPAGPFQLESSLGLTAGELNRQLNTVVVEGSAISILRNFQAGDVFSFNSNFQTFDNFNIDRAFVSIVNSTTNPVITPLTLGNSTFNYTFSAAGNYTVGIGVFDANSSEGSSRLIVSNANVAPVPEPLTILGSLTALGLGANMRRRFAKSR